MCLKHASNTRFLQYDTILKICRTIILVYLVCDTSVFQGSDLPMHTYLVNMLRVPDLSILKMTPGSAFNAGTTILVCKTH